MLLLVILFSAFCRLLVMGCGNVNTDLQNTNAEGAWPWMVAITKKERGGHYIHCCNGFLIDRRHVVTAAHCFDIKDNDSDFLARIGKTNRNEGETYEVTCIIKHPRYERGLYYDDIAILTLSRRVDTPNYNPICLPSENLRIKSLSGAEVTKTAWGAVKPGGTISETLIQNAGLRIISNKDCNMMVRNFIRISFLQQFPGGVSGDMVCTKNPTEQTESCEGDSGAPLMYKDESNKWIAVGVSAFGLSCGTDVPSGFIKISDYLEWITENTIDDPVVHCTRFSDKDLNQLIVHYDDEDILAGSMAHFSCKFNDREFSGKSESVCCRDGKWSSPPPQCKDLCPPIDENEVFAICYSNGRKINSTATFYCKETKFLIQGDHIKTCLPTGKWSLANPTCNEPAVRCTRFWDDDLKLLTVYYDDKAHFSCKDKDQVLSGKNESVCLRNGKWTSPPPQCKGCGTRLDDYRPQVIEGRNVTEGAWPWMVAITMQESNGTHMPWCNGFLIDRRHVLSVAHCFTFEDKPVSNYQARIGRVNQLEGDIYHISHIAVYPGYQRYMSYDDIAILTLARQVTTYGYNAICLPDEELSKKDLVGKETSVAGWKPFARFYGSSPKLQQIQGLLIMDTQECNRTLKMTHHNSFPRGVNSGFICTGPEIEKKGCSEYNGGPLMFQEKNIWYAIGILSYACGPSKQPLVFTRVSQYLDWIAENTSD